MNRDEILQAWIDDATQTISALIVWRTWLQTWRDYPLNSNAEFMAAIEKMKEAGLETWLDQHPLGLDELREVVTG